MIFLAGSLNMNGGSTFLLRMAHELQARGEKIAVVVLSDVVDAAVRAELEKDAEVVMLKDLLHPAWSWVGTNQIAAFLPARRRAVSQLLSSHGRSVHAMGIFGLILAMRWNSVFGAIKISAGVYHQNEFLFESDDFFSRQAKQLFRALPTANLVFFNDYTRTAYARFFKTDYAGAMVLPIGIVIPKPVAGGRRDAVPGLLVSVGNLVAFKTYNEHVIRIVGELRHVFPELRYEIYGSGENQAALQRVAEEAGALPAVRFNGPIPYSRFGDVAGAATAFIGSGTALVEAAALGVPSIVGIESITEPATYGFISDVEGLTYNERVPGVPLVPMRDLIVRLLNGEAAEVARTGEACAEKAGEFSIQKTVDGFTRLSVDAEAVRHTEPAMAWWQLLAAFLSVAVADRLGINKTFRQRRNQSSIG